MLTAFICARIAHDRADATQLDGRGTAARHRPDRCRARLRTLACETDARHHHLDVGLVEAGVGAHFARYETRDARLDAVMRRRRLRTEIRAELYGRHALLAILTVALTVLLGFIMLLAVLVQPVSAVAMRCDDVVGLVTGRVVQLLDDALTRAVAVLALGVLLCTLHLASVVAGSAHCSLSMVFTHSQNSRNRQATDAWSSLVRSVHCVKYHHYAELIDDE
jgi:hypothetical protein